MDDRKALILTARGVLRVAGPDARAFLQSLVSNDVERLSSERALWSAFLTPQGKYLHDFFMTTAPGDGPDDTAVLLDCEDGRRDDLKRRLGIYKLRAKVEIADATERYSVAALFGDGALDALGLPPEAGRAAPFADGLAYVDPRLTALGARALLPKGHAAETLTAAGFAQAAVEDYERRRIALGVPDGSRDLPVERALLLENGFDELNGVDWAKGCFVGQELTARTKYRALIKKRLLPVEIEGPTPAPGTPVLRDGKEAGEMRSSADGFGLALLRLEHLETAAPGALTAGEARLTLRWPDWVKI